MEKHRDANNSPEREQMWKDTMAMNKYTTETKVTKDLKPMKQEPKKNSVFGKVS